MIYIICPTIYASGGPVAIHQMARKLLNMGIEVSIYYLNPNNIELDDQLKVFNIPKTTVINDAKENVIVFPELLISKLNQFKNAKKVLWWLSVNNAVWNDVEPTDLASDKSIIHFSQSAYSTMYLTQVLHIPSERIFYVSDYLNPVFLDSPIDWKRDLEGNIITCEKKRERTILFNPKKGFGVTNTFIMFSNGSVKWQALNGMTPEAMRDAMRNAMVYIDFGEHPGMDRIPREAALSGCIVLTNKHGSAGNNIDVPIPEICKIDDGAEPLAVMDIIYSMMNDYDSKYQNLYQSYIDGIKKQFQLFEVSLLHAFGPLVKHNKLEEEKKSDEETLRNSIGELVATENYIDAYRQMVMYRHNGYAENEEFCILEAYIRIAFDEIREAEYCVRQALLKYPKSYELYLMMANIIKMKEADSVDEQILNTSCQRAIEYSKGTDDEQTVMEAIEAIGN